MKIAQRCIILYFQKQKTYIMGYHTIELSAKVEIKTENCNFRVLTFLFLNSLRGLFEQFMTLTLLHYYEEYYKNGHLKTLLQIDNYGRKSTSKKTKFKTLFGDIWLPQIEIRSKDKESKEHQMSITRVLLGVDKGFQIPNFMKEILGFMSALCTYRSAHKILPLLTNFKISLMSVWASVQWYSQKIVLSLSENGINEFEADGTGIPTHNSGKRGSEIKKVFQRKKDGKLQFIGIEIGKYKDSVNWYSALSKPIEEGLKRFGKLILASDGDKSIQKEIKARALNVKFQADLWHVFHQMYYYLRLDKVSKSLSI